MKSGTKVTITTPPFLGSRASTSSGTLRGWSVTARAEECEKMTGDTATSSASCMVCGRDVREVDQHPQAVHLAHHLRAEAGEAAVLGLVGRGVGPVAVRRVGERHVARAGGVELAQDGERVLDGVAALHADQRGHLAGAMDAHDVVGGVGHLERVGVALGQPVDDVDLLEDGSRRARSGEIGGDVDRPELAAEVARLAGAPRSVCIGGSSAAGVAEVDAVEVVVDPRAVLPGDVVVAVDEGGRGEDFEDHLQPVRLVGGDAQARARRAERQSKESGAVATPPRRTARILTRARRPRRQRHEPRSEW